MMMRMGFLNKNDMNHWLSQFDPALVHIFNHDHGSPLIGA